MKPLMIEVSFDDGEQVVPSGIPGWVASLLHEFGFQSTEATFRRCVDPSNFPSGSWIDSSPPHREPCGNRRRRIGCRDLNGGSGRAAAFAAG